MIKLPMVFISLLHFNNGKSQVYAILTRYAKKLEYTRTGVYLYRQKPPVGLMKLNIQRIDEYFTYRITLLIWDQRILFGKL